MGNLTFKCEGGPPRRKSGPALSIVFSLESVSPPEPGYGLIITNVVPCVEFDSLELTSMIVSVVAGVGEN